VESERDRTDALDRKAAALASFASLVLSLTAILSREPQVQVQGETMDVLVRMLAKERDINRKKARDVRIAFVLLFAGLIFMASESIVLVARQAFP
jgi:hypothetical protein